MALFSTSVDFVADCWKTLGDKRIEGATVVVAVANWGGATCQEKEYNSVLGKDCYYNTLTDQVHIDSTVVYYSRFNTSRGIKCLKLHTSRLRH